MLFIYFKSLLYIITSNGGDNLKDKHEYIWVLLGKNNFYCEFLPWTCYFMSIKSVILISIGFCVFALQSFREILKKSRKRAITHLQLFSRWLIKKKLYTKLRQIVFNQLINRVIVKWLNVRKFNLLTIFTKL